ncbi:hypothetical protein [Deinococcus frigens]|uniref:hypothetical protein n=1 Tax=Deinococcus frigens TaxID=249403 RepID=UPI001FDF98DB|nr:hypothetical protein [Deinococcus frigens]
MRPSPAPLPSWVSRLSAWPGVLTLLSVLAVVLGAPVHPPETGTRLSASNVAPPLPELRAMPQPGPGAPVLTPPPAEPFRVLRARQVGRDAHWSWTQPAPLSDLNVLGRRQTDGG